MPFLTSAILYKTAAAIYAAIVPGHILMGYQVVYPALDKIPKTTSEDKTGERGASNCWGLATTSLATLALLHWRWANTKGPQTWEETAMLIANTAHVALNAVKYLQVGEIKAGGALITASLTTAAAYVMRGQ